MNKLNRTLIVILVVQLGLAAVVLWPRPATTEESQSLFSGLETNHVVRVTITGIDGARIELAKEGADWVLPEADGYPVRGDAVSSLLVKIAGLRTGRAVTETSPSHERLGVAENAFERRVELEMDDGARHTLYVGTSPSYGATHVRAGGQDEVYLTSDLTAYDVGVLATDWADRTYFSVPQDQVVGLKLENATGALQFVRIGVAGEEPAPGQVVWSLADQAPDETVNAPAVQALLTRLSSVAMLRPLGTEEKAEYGMDNPAAVVTLRTQSEEGSKTYTLRVGAQDPADGSYAVSSSESPYYVRVSEFTVQSFIKNTRQDFLELPPMPEATPVATPEG